MKVVILGPVVNEKLSGGVGVFDEGLYKGFKNLGDDVYLISVASSSSVPTICIGNGNGKTRKIYFSFNKIGKIIKTIKPDLVICSLQYCVGIRMYKKCWNKALYVAVLHGFPCTINGRLKANLVNFVARYSRKHFDKVVTVSFLSFAINKKINRITCDKVIHNGCSLISSECSINRDIDFIYIGRLFRDKEIEMIANAFIRAKKMNHNLKFVVAGYGEFEESFKNGKFKCPGIEFIGKLSQNDVKKYLSRSKFFISMNPLEPFGTVFNEAVINGCNIVTQNTSGGMSLFYGKPYFHSADCVNETELANKLIAISDRFKSIDDDEKKSLIDYLSYKRCAQEYKELLDE